MAKKYLTRTQVTRIFEAAETQQDYVIELLKEALAMFDISWDNVKSLDGYIKVAPPGDHMLMGMAIDFDKIHHPEVLAGGCWLNYGFSTEEGLKAFADKWEVTIPTITLKQ